MCFFDHCFNVASIPTTRLNVHVRRLVNLGYKVRVQIVCVFFYYNYVYIYIYIAPFEPNRKGKLFLEIKGGSLRGFQSAIRMG